MTPTCGERKALCDAAVEAGSDGRTPRSQIVCE